MSFAAFLKTVEQGQNLTALESQTAFDFLFEGAVPAEQIGAFLLALRKKGETVDELLGAVVSMRGKALSLQAPPDAIDIVGTGGDSHNTLNISTAVAFVVAGCGVPVAKHGNRAASSLSGSSDILASLGINLDADFATLEQCLTEAKLCFLFAPRHHPSMRHVAEVRKKLRVRTIFNLLGPLTNPANVKRHVIGVYDPTWLEPMAQVLKSLGSEVAWFVHGSDGMDEITTTAPTSVVELYQGKIRRFTLEPEQAGLPHTRLDDLKGGDAVHNAAELRKLFLGQAGAYRDIVLLNAAAALIIAGKTDDLTQGVKVAGDALDNGAAQAVLDKLIQLTNRNMR